MDAKGVDRAVAVLRGGPGPMMAAIVQELVDQGYDVYLPRALVPSDDAWAPWQVARLHLDDAVDGSSEGARRRWSLAVVSGDSLSHPASARLVEAVHVRREARLLVVAASAAEVADADAHLLGADRSRISVLAPAGTRGRARSRREAPWVARRARSRTPWWRRLRPDDPARAAARRGLQGARDGCTHVAYDVRSWPPDPSGPPPTGHVPALERSDPHGPTPPRRTSR